MTAIALPRARRFVPPQVSLLALRVWQRNRDVYFNVWRSELIWPLVEPLVTLLALGLGLGDFVNFDETNIDYIDFIGPALIAVFPMWTATAECTYGSFFRMDQQGTFNAMVATPVSVDEITTGEILWAMTRSLMGVCYIIVMVVIFGGINSLAALLIFPFAIVPGLTFGAIALAYSSVAKTVSSLNYFFATYITPQFWLSGAFFPLNEMPHWIEVVAWFTPAYHVVRPYRAFADGHVNETHLVDLAFIATLGVVAYLVAIVLMRRRMVK
jgi:lipooligosaccharide transport system permease protein